LGRFLQPEPNPAVLLGTARGQGDLAYNPYAYAGNNPANFADPSGFSPEDRRDPNTLAAEDWWNQWAVQQLVTDHDGIVGNLKAGLASVEFAFLEHYISPIETAYHNLSDLDWVAAHPIGRFKAGLDLAVGLFELLDPLSLTGLEKTERKDHNSDQTDVYSLKATFNESLIAKRIRILETGESKARR